MAFNAIEAFHQRQEYQGPDVWQEYEELGIDILDFSDTPVHLLYWASRNIPTPLKQRLRQNQDFQRLASKSLDLCRENALDWFIANRFTKKDGSVHTKG